MKLLDMLINSIRASAAYNSAVQAAPDCILWTDAELQWQAALPLLLDAMPELFALGEYEPAKRQGPAIWLRCILGRKIKDAAIPNGQMPVFYLPGVGRPELRAVDACPKALRPLAPLQYSGVFFSRPNAKDLTLPAWLASADGGPGLDVAKDNETRLAMLASLPKLLQEDNVFLRGKRLDKDFFNSLLTGGDLARDILQWLNGAEAFRAGRRENEWRAFVELCKSGFAFDPEKSGPLLAAENLARHEGPWKAVWERYHESWNHFPNIEEQLRKCPPPREMPGWHLAEAANTGWPQWNDEQEEALREELAALSNLPPHECAKRLLELEKRHGPRRATLWAEIGQAPLGAALRHLAVLAENFGAPFSTGAVEEIAAQYAATGWKMDDAALKAMAECQEARDKKIIEGILRNIYLPWLEAASRNLQDFFERNPYPPMPCPNAWQVAGPDAGQDAWNDGDCILFVDGLRMDCAKNLAHLLAGNGLNIAEQIYWAPLPSLTATGKPAVSPVCGQIAGLEENADFEPAIAVNGKPVKGNFEKLLAEAGWEILKKGAAGSGMGRAWAEFGALDQEGHHRGGKLAWHLPALVAEIAKYIDDLLKAGWKRVFVVSDHGWLWLPGGLPKSDLPACLVENKWGRCAVPKAGAIISERRFPWHWNKNCYFALADGARCFKAGQEYAHGGLSLQECLLLEIIVEGTAKKDNARLEEIKWSGLRCKLVLQGAFAGLRADIRLEPGEAASSVAVCPKAFKSDGAVSIFVEDEENEGRPAWIVLLDAENRIVAQEKTVIGGCWNGNG